MGITETFAKYVHGVTFGDLPEDVVAVTKKSVIDTLGVIIAGSRVDGCRLLVDYIRDWGGKAESTIAVFGGKVPCALAAQANGAMARAHEIDDVHDVAPVHSSASVIPTCLAVAERCGSVDGKAFITAAALGQDLMIRMAKSLKHTCIVSGRYNLFHGFVLACCAGKLMNMNETQLLNAMGISYTQLVGDGKAAKDGVMTSYIQQGTKAKSGIEAALMAAKGITGTRDVLEAPGGFYDIYEPDPNTAFLSSDLGKVFAGTEIAVKLHSACRCTHQAIDLAEVARSKGLNADNIDNITVRVNDQTYMLVCSPPERKKKPQTPVDAMFSVPYTVAAAIMRGRLFIDEVNEEAIKDPSILKLVGKVTTVLDPLCQSDLALGSVTMEIKTVTGDTVTLESKYPRGNPNNPATMDDCIEKFKMCVEHSAVDFSKGQEERIIEAVANLEKLQSIDQLCELLSPGSSSD